jgi:hypothetical protein
MGYHLSKQRRKRPRLLLYLVAMNIVQRNQSMNKLYDRLLKSGRKRKDAPCIIMHKLVRIIYALLKKKTKYQADLNIVGNVEQTNMETGKNSVKNGEIRRFQDFQKLFIIKSFGMCRNPFLKGFRSAGG